MAEDKSPEMNEEKEDLTGASVEQEEVKDPTKDSKFTADEGEKSDADKIVEEAQKKSKFLQADLIKDAWKRDGLDPVFEEYLKSGKLNVNPNGGLMIDLKNGHRLNWMPKNGDKPEFIGMVGKEASKKFDMDDARAVMAACKSKGWDEVELHGAPQHKNMMWLEAQRQGLSVKNFTPDPSVFAKWQKEKDGLNKKPVIEEKTGVEPVKQQPIEKMKM